MVDLELPAGPIPDRVPSQWEWRLLLGGGVLGGILGTSGMVIGGVTAEVASGVRPADLLGTLEIGFGGALAGAGALGPSWGLPVHYLHGIVLGLLLAALIRLGARFELTRGLSPSYAGPMFGLVLSPFVTGFLVWTDPGVLTLDEAVFIVVLHVVFGALAGLALDWTRRAIRRPT